MSPNSSSSSSSSLVLFQNLTFSSAPPLSLYFQCIASEPGSVLFITFSITNPCLLLPLCLFILHHGLQQCRGQRSSSYAAAALSHSDCFTYHMVAMELIGAFGCIISGCGFFTHQFDIVYAGIVFYDFIWYGQIFFHVLTCAERYLAVVHPVTYLKLKNERWVRIRNISTCCVWLVCIVILIVVHVQSQALEFFFLVLSAATISFCSVSVLWALIRPGPGEQVRGRERPDRSKQRAFYTIMTILGVLVCRFAWSLYCSFMYLTVEHNWVNCVMMSSNVWVNLPTSLVLPLLFLIRRGKIKCCKLKTERG